MKIVVTTPTGHVGSRVVQLLQAGARPTLLLRDPNKLDPATRERVDAFQCDQGDTDLVVRATEGADSLFWVDPPTLDDDPVAGYARMGASAARAVRENGITRTVFLSSVGAEKRSGAGEIDGLARTEEQLDATGATVLHLRCGYFFTNLLLELQALREGILRTAMPIDRPIPWVDPRDIGEVVSQAVGRQVRAETISDADLRSALRSAGLGDKQIEGIVGMSSGLRGDFVAEDERSILTTRVLRNCFRWSVPCVGGLSRVCPHG